MSDFQTTLRALGKAKSLEELRSVLIDLDMKVLLEEPAEAVFVDVALTSGELRSVQHLIESHEVSDLRSMMVNKDFETALKGKKKGRLYKDVLKVVRAMARRLLLERTMERKKQAGPGMRALRELDAR